MHNKLRMCAVLTSLGFAFYAAHDVPALPTKALKADQDINDRLARLHAAQDAGSFRVEIVGRLKEKLGTPDGADASELKTADWKDTFKQRFKDNGTPS